MAAGVRGHIVSTGRTQREMNAGVRGFFCPFYFQSGIPACGTGPPTFRLGLLFSGKLSEYTLRSGSLYGVLISLHQLDSG